MSKERVLWIDVCRGLGILTILYGHGLDAHSIRYFFYSFHIPLFFFISGMVFNHKDHENIISAIKKAWHRTLFPYFLFAFLSYGLWLLIKHPLHPALLKDITNVLYGSGHGDGLFFNVVLWFLPCLFATQILFAALVSISKKRTFLIPSVIGFSLIGYVISLTLPNLALPFGFEATISAVAFFGIGFLFYQEKEKLLPVIRKWKIPLMILSLICTILFANWNFHLYGHQIDMRLNHLNNYFLFYLGALAGIIMTICLGVLLEKMSVFSVLGKCSLIIFVWHLTAFWFIANILNVFIPLHVLNEFRNTIFAPIYTVVAIIAILFMASLIKKVHAPLKRIRLSFS